jgi:hypothetical protein
VETEGQDDAGLGLVDLHHRLTMAELVRCFRAPHDEAVPGSGRRVGQRKVKETPCNSLFRHGLIRPALTPRKHALTCATVLIWSFMILTVRMVPHI